MPSFGICGGLDRASDAKAAGFDFLETGVAGLLQPLEADDSVARLPDDLPLPVRALNGFVPGQLRIVGPNRDEARLREFVGRVASRAERLGVEHVVFGSGGARSTKGEVDEAEARKQIEAFCGMLAEAADGLATTFVIEPLRSEESDMITGVADGARYVQAANSPRVRLLIDAYHHWSEGHSIEDIVATAPLIEHVHVADLHGRAYPGLGEGDNPYPYAEFFAPLKAAGFDGKISIEARGEPTVEQMAAAVALLHEAWDAA